MWIPGMERYYNERVPQRHVFALASEYIEFSIPSAARYEAPYPENQSTRDEYSDSLFLLPRIRNYADPIAQYYAAVVAQKEEAKGG